MWPGDDGNQEDPLAAASRAFKRVAELRGDEVRGEVDQCMPGRLFRGRHVWDIIALRRHNEAFLTVDNPINQDGDSRNRKPVFSSMVSEGVGQERGRGEK